MYQPELATLAADDALLTRVMRKLTQARLIVTDQSLEAKPSDPLTENYSYAEVATSLSVNGRSFAHGWQKIVCICRCAACWLWPLRNGPNTTRTPVTCTAGRVYNK